MVPLRKALVFALSFALGFLATQAVTTALASDGATPPTGHPLVDQVFAWLGMAVAALSTLATVLPRHWRFTQLCARFSADLRGILTPDPSDDPAWVKRMRGSTTLLLATVLTLALGCGVFRDAAAPAVVECAPDRQYLIDGLSAILDGENAFDVLDGIRRDKGAEFVMCTLQRFLDRVAVSPETATQRATASAYLDSRR